MSVSLLEYQPSVQNGSIPEPEVSNNLTYEEELSLMQKISKGILTDTYFNFTPDTPALRYAGVQYVLMCDTLAHVYKLEKQLNLKEQNDFRVVEFTSFTEESFFPVRMGTNLIIPPRKSWRNDLNDDEVKYHNLHGMALPIQGKLFQFSLSGMQALDNHYKNTAVTQRLLVPVLNSKGVKTFAWVYFTKLDSVTVWDPHTKKQKFTRKCSVFPLTQIDKGNSIGFKNKFTKVYYMNPFTTE